MRRLPRLIDWCLLGVLAVGAIAAVVWGLQLLGFSWDWFEGESLNVFFARRVLSGEALYQQWDDGRLIFPIYPPGMYWALVPVQALAGDALWAGRLLSMVATLFTVFAAVRVARRLRCSVGESLASGLGALAFFAVAAVGHAVRPDALALALGAGALLAVTKWEDDERFFALFIAAVATAAMIATKHNFAPLAGALFIAVWVRKRRSALAFGAIAFVLTGAMFAIAALTSGGAFFRNATDFSGVGYSLSALLGIVRDGVLPFPNPILVVAGIEVLMALRRWREARAAHLYWIGSLFVLATAVKLGSGANYWAASGFASAVLLGPALAQLRNAAGINITAAAAAFLALSLAPQAAQAVTDLVARARLIERLDEANADAVRRISAIDGPFLGTRQDLTIAAGRTPVFDAPPFSILADAEKWDPELLAHEIERKRFAMIQSGFDLQADSIPLYQSIRAWPPPLVRAARTSYCLVWSSPLPSFAGQGIWLYEPCPD